MFRSTRASRCAQRKCISKAPCSLVPARFEAAQHGRGAIGPAAGIIVGRRERRRRGRGRDRRRRGRGRERVRRAVRRTRGSRGRERVRQSVERARGARGGRVDDRAVGPRRTYAALDRRVPLAKRTGAAREEARAGAVDVAAPTGRDAVPPRDSGTVSCVKLDPTSHRRRAAARVRARGGRDEREADDQEGRARTSRTSAAKVASRRARRRRRDAAATPPRRPRDAAARLNTASSTNRIGGGASGSADGAFSRSSDGASRVARSHRRRGSRARGAALLPWRTGLPMG